MSREQLIKKHPELFLEIIREGIELCMYGHTTISSVKELNEANKKIKERVEFWNSLAENENDFISSII